MGIPSIVGYPMPAESELPDTVVPWRPDAGRAVLLIHDMQRYFVDFFPPGEPMNTLVRNAVQLRRAAVDLGVPVVYTAQPGGMSPEERGLLRDFWGRGMGTDRHSRQIVEELAPALGFPAVRASVRPGVERLVFDVRPALRRVLLLREAGQFDP